MGRKYTVKPEKPISVTQEVYVVRKMKDSDVDWFTQMVMEQGGGTVLVIHHDGTEERIEVPPLHVH